MKMNTHPLREDFWITFIATNTFQNLIKSDNRCFASLLINLRDSLFQLRQYLIKSMEIFPLKIINIQINLLRHVIPVRVWNWWKKEIQFISIWDAGTSWIFSANVKPQTPFKTQEAHKLSFLGNLFRSWKVGKVFFFWNKLALSLYRVNKHFIWKISPEERLYVM